MIVDLTITIDGLLLEGGATVEEYIEKIEEITNSQYEILYEITYKEDE